MKDEYISGFFDGEGSLSVRIREDKRYKTGFQVLLRAEITQKNRRVLEMLKDELKIGNIYFNSHDKLWQYMIHKIKDLEKFVKIILPWSIVKKESLSKFEECVRIVINNQHLTHDGIDKIRNLWFVRESEANTP